MPFTSTRPVEVQRSPSRVRQPIVSTGPKPALSAQAGVSGGTVSGSGGGGGGGGEGAGAAGAEAA